MDTNEQPKRRAKRITDRTMPSSPSRGRGDYRTLNLDLVTHAGLETAAKKRGVSARKFAAAAITYFVEAGLDPTQMRTQTLASVASRVGDAELTLREHGAKIGNRLVEILRAWEKQQYEQMMLIQASHFKHLEAVEANLMRYLVLLQEQSLAPMLETLMRYGIDANIARKMGERVFMHLTGVEREQWLAQHKIIDKGRDEQVIAELRGLLDKYDIPHPNSTASPKLIPVPPPAARAASPAVPMGATTSTKPPAG